MQIYNETVTDLLQPSATNLQLREEVKRGAYVDGLSEEIILNGAAFIARVLARRLRLPTRANKQRQMVPLESSSFTQRGHTLL